jgi:Right handed beta helix region
MLSVPDLCVAVVLALPLAASLAQAATLTITPADSLAQAVSRLRAGDTLLLRAGTYSEGINSQAMELASGTSWDNAVTISAYPGERVVVPTVNINGYGTTAYRYIIISGLVVDGGGVFFGGPRASAIRLQDSEVYGTVQSGIASYDASGIELLRNRIHDNGRGRLDHGIYALFPYGRIEGNTIYNNSGYGLQFYNSGCTTPADLAPKCGMGTVIRNNTIHDNRGDGGVVLSYGDQVCFSGNTVARNQYGSLHLGYGHPTGFRIVGNTFEDNGGAGINVGTDVVNTLVANNTFRGNRGPDVDDQGTGTTTMAPGASTGDCPMTSGAPPPPPRHAPRNLRVVTPR